MVNPDTAIPKDAPVFVDFDFSSICFRSWDCCEILPTSITSDKPPTITVSTSPIMVSSYLVDGGRKDGATVGDFDGDGDDFLLSFLLVVVVVVLDIGSGLGGVCPFGVAAPSILGGGLIDSFWLGCGPNIAPSSP